MRTWLLRLLDRDGKISELERRIEVLTSSHLEEWQEFMQAQDPQNGFSKEQEEARVLVDDEVKVRPFPQGFLNTLSALADPDTLDPHLVKFCYMLSMKGRLEGRSVDYSDALTKFIELCRAIRYLYPSKKR